MSDPEQNSKKQSKIIQKKSSERQKRSSEAKKKRKENNVKAQKITEESIKDLKVSSLPTRPTSPTDFGGRGYTAQQMKAAFDRLPLYLAERFNLLLEDVGAVGEDSLAGAIMTDIQKDHSLSRMFSDIKSGKFAEYLTVSDRSLTMELAQIKERLLQLEEKYEQNTN